ncbi:hypothetical protein NPIL_352381 [Nephila pilipes]|uniref:Uncharacterized protein n=1 Tax=Nephila pilipes TaxID=299642 RepID=A0A8X6Q3M4_NEPPI|nr:hypothetical protein NPIL_352381 [Nephila pilipes]
MRKAFSCGCYEGVGNDKIIASIARFVCGNLLCSRFLLKLQGVGPITGLRHTSSLNGKEFVFLFRREVFGKRARYDYAALLCGEMRWICSC